MAAFAKPALNPVLNAVVYGLQLLENALKAHQHGGRGYYGDQSVCNWGDGCVLLTPSLLPSGM